MKAELQGEGSYTYECKDPGCWFCEMMGLKPPVCDNKRAYIIKKFKQPLPEVFIIPPAVIYDDEQVDRKTVSTANLTKYQREKLRVLAFPKVQPSFMKFDRTY
jgi:hypothetical protein